MMKSFAIISLLTTAVLAQSSSGTPAPTPSSTANPLIPSDISKSCTDFLTAFNSDKSLTTCTTALIASTASYAPGGNGTTSPSAAKIGSTLNNLCSTTMGDNCPESLIRGKIADFYSACSAELTSNAHPDVIRTYDVLYTMTPLRTAICSKDDNGSYCVTQTKAPATSGLNAAISLNGGSSGLTPAALQKYIAVPAVNPTTLTRRADEAALIPNVTTYRAANLPFLFLQASLPAETLCTACTRNVLTAYINFESNVPYAPGLNKSTLLSGQSALYLGVQTTCGKNFLSGAVQAAGGLSGGTFSSGAVQNVGGSQGYVSAIIGVLALIASVY